MKLLPENLKRTMPALNSTEAIPSRNKLIHCKFFNPSGPCTWYVIEGEEIDGDILFFGLVDFFDKELGYFSLQELENVKLPRVLRLSATFTSPPPSWGNSCPRRQPNT